MKEFNVKDFGAASDGTLQTEKIQSAIDACFIEGGGKVIIPEGEYLTGGIRLRSNITLYLKSGAILKGSRNPEDYFGYINDKIEPLSESEITDAPYVHICEVKGETEYVENREEYRYKRTPGSRWNNAIIRTINAENVAIIGEEGSVIDGDNCYDEIGEEQYRGPHGMTMFKTKNIKLSGYTIKNCGNWAHNLLFCENISVSKITALAGHDGFDAAVSRNITIADSEFYTGDDCIAGFGNANIYISGCILNSACSAMRFSGTNVLVENCRMYSPCRYSFRGRLTKEEKESGAMVASAGRYNMLSAFTYYGDYTLPIKEQPGNIIIRNCEMENAGKMLHYHYGREGWQRNRPMTDITFENVVAKGITLPMIVCGDKNVPFTLKLKNVNVDIGNGEQTPDTFMYAEDFEKIELENFTLKNFKGDAVILKKSGGTVEAINSDIGKAQLTTDASEKIDVRSI